MTQLVAPHHLVSPSSSVAADVTTHPHDVVRHSVIADVSQLVRPRIAMLVLVTVFAAMWLTSASHELNWLSVVGVLFGTAVVAASSSIANQILERHTDRLMARTASPASCCWTTIKSFCLASRWSGFLWRERMRVVGRKPAGRIRRRCLRGFFTFAYTRH